MSSYQSSNFAGEIWLQWFGCCTNQPAQQRKRQAVQRSRARIDRSTIGYPMNFQHTVHIGSGDLEIESSHLDALQGQMQSKGGYGKAYVVKWAIPAYFDALQPNRCSCFITSLPFSALFYIQLSEEDQILVYSEAPDICITGHLRMTQAFLIECLIQNLLLYYFITNGLTAVQVQAIHK